MGEGIEKKGKSFYKMEIKLTDENFKREVLESVSPCLVDFWAEWCTPCSMVAPTVEEIARKYEGKLKVCKLNVDDGAQTASKYGIMSIPTLAIFKGGKVVVQIIGALPKEEVEAKLKPFVE